MRTLGMRPLVGLVRRLGEWNIRDDRILNDLRGQRLPQDGRVTQVHRVATTEKAAAR